MIGIGSSVGNYRVMKKLGSGAMGSVFLAEHPVIGKKVALKVIHSDLAENEEMVSRFFNEARAVTRIGHENIIEVIDFGQTPDGDNFIVMELLEGESLGDKLKETPILGVDETCQIAVQIAEGLEASHQRGIVHRDLKPDNVYLVAKFGKTNFVKILDFGLAKLTQGGGALSHKTRAGSVLGTPHYMAPEQCEGKPDIDHRVDIYALGCILYQMLCGRVPFPGEGFGEVLVKHLREPPVMPSKLNPAVPRGVEAIILHALAKRKEFRFQSMREMAVALRDPDKWLRALDGEALLRATGETDLSAVPHPMPEPSSSLPEIRGPVPKGDMDSPTQLERTVGAEPAPALGATAFGAAPPSTPASSAATLMLEAPPLPAMILPTPRHPTMGMGAVDSSQYLVPAQNNTGRRFLVVLAAVVVAVVVGVVLLRVTERPPAAAPPVVAPAPPPRTVIVQSVPSGAEVVREGKPVGLTPMVLKVPPEVKTFDLVLRKEGFEQDQRTVDPNDDDQVLVTLKATAPEVAPAPAPPPPKAAPERRARSNSPAGEGEGSAEPARRARPERQPPSKKPESVGEDDILAPSL